MKQEKNYTYRSMRDERQYGLFWYSGLWHILRPVLVGLAVLVLVAGIVTAVWNRLYSSFAAPVDDHNGREYTFEVTSGMSLSSVANKLEGNEVSRESREWDEADAPVNENDSREYLFEITGDMDLRAVAEKLAGNPQMIRSAAAFMCYCEMAGLESRIMAGTYSLQKKMSMRQIAETLAGNTSPGDFPDWDGYAAPADGSDTRDYVFEITEDMDLRAVARKLEGSENCPVCGAALAEQARHCDSCGAFAQWQPRLIRSAAVFAYYCEFAGLEQKIKAGTYTLWKDMSTQQVAEQLAGVWRPQLIRSKTAFKYYCDFAGMGQKIQVGTYTLGKDMTMEEIAEQLTTGDGNPMVRNITLIPGETIEDFAAKLVRTGVLKNDETFLKLCRDGKTFQGYECIDYVLRTTTANKRKYILEGYLAPNTYEVYVDADEETIIRKLLSQTEAVFDEFRTQAAKQGKNMDQVLTLASIIEKEAKESDFAKVSAVFYNRQDKGMPLQSDVTVHYVTGIRRMALTDADTSVSSPYNTYKNTGLPVGPICNPSPAAIRAALYPDEAYRAEKYLYFCARYPESGELAFSKTLEEHESYVAVYKKYWVEYDRSRGIGE